jgi:precorrin-6B methylase 2
MLRVVPVVFRKQPQARHTGKALSSPSKRSYHTSEFRNWDLASNFVWAFLIITLLIAVFILWSAAVGAGWEPTSRKKVRRMLEMSGAGPSDVVYDLGSGDGRILVEAAKTYHARAVGVEADPIRVLFSRLAVSILNLRGQVKIVWGNFFHTDLSEATIVTLFLSQGTNRKLESKLLAELKPGTRVVSYVWTFDNWTPMSRDPNQNLSMYVIKEQARPSSPPG